MTSTIQAVRGMNDIMPPAISHWHFVEERIRALVSGYGYQECRSPLLENTHLFKRSIGAVTDIVEKEMYTFTDLNGDSLSLRPEGTAGCVRAGIENGLLYNQIQRLWYMGPMYRHERPQKGRYRQFNQFGVEAFGMSTPEIDAEVILLSSRLWRQLGLAETLTLEINSLGTVASRKAHKQALVDYFTQLESRLDEDSKRRLTTNPLRILDSKNPDLATIISQAPSILDFLLPEEAAHFARVQALLTQASIPYKINPYLVRGLDYYTHTVFEWTTTHLGAQTTVCAGGRYDGLVEQLGGKPTPGVGFALGLERLLLLLETLNKIELPITKAVYVMGLTEQGIEQAMRLAEALRAELTITVILDCVGGALKKQIKRADKSVAQIGIIIGEDELKHNTVIIKYLREERGQASIDREGLTTHLKRYFSID